MYRAKSPDAGSLLSVRAKPRAGGQQKRQRRPKNVFYRKSFRTARTEPFPPTKTRIAEKPRASMLPARIKSQLSDCPAAETPRGKALSYPEAPIRSRQVRSLTCGSGNGSVVCHLRQSRKKSGIRTFLRCCFIRTADIPFYYNANHPHLSRECKTDAAASGQRTPLRSISGGIRDPVPTEACGSGTPACA